MSLPWDRFPSEDEELPYREPVSGPGPAPIHPPVTAPGPPASSPTPAPPANTIDISDALADALNDVWPAVREQAISYARDSVKAVTAGQTVDILRPTITAADMTGKELVVADAKSRSWRTLLQGLAIDLLFAVAALLSTLTHADVLDKASWTIFFVLLGKTLIQTAAAYFMRLKVTPTIRTEGEKYAIAPVPRPMIDTEERNHIP